MKAHWRRSWAVLCAFGVVLGLAGSAAATPAYWGYMVPNSGQEIYQWEVAQWVDQYFNDGSAGNRTVSTPMSLYFTQCYGGDWLATFDQPLSEPRLGFLYDRWSFPNAAAYSANDVGKVAYYYGYHTGASAAFDMVASSASVHSNGFLHKDYRETPLSSGPEVNPIGTINNYVLVFAGKPEKPDGNDVYNVITNLADDTIAGMYVLYGNGTDPLVDGAATRANVQLALFGLGTSMTNNPGDRFAMFVTDHGGLATVEIAPPSLGAFSSLNLNLGLKPGQLQGAQMASEAMLSFATFQALSPEVLANLNFMLNDELLDPTSIMSSPIQLPDLPDPGILYSFHFTSDFLLAAEGGTRTEPLFDQALEIINNGESEIEFAWIALGTGDVPKFPPVPEPAGLGLLGLTLLAVRRKRG